MAGCSLKFASSSGLMLAGPLANPSAPVLPDLQSLSSFAFPAWPPQPQPYLAKEASRHRTAAPERRRAEGQKGWRRGREADLARWPLPKQATLNKCQDSRSPAAASRPSHRPTPICGSTPPELNQEESDREARVPGLASALLRAGAAMPGPRKNEGK